MADTTTEPMDFEARLIDHITESMKKISNKFIAQAQRMRNSIKSLGDSFLNLKTFFAAGIGYAAFKKTVGAAAQFEKQMKEVSTLSEEVANNLGDFSQGILDLSQKSGQSLNTLTKGLYDAISAGVDTGEALKFLESATQLAIGGATDTATAIDGMTTIMNAFSLESSQATEITDAFFTAIKFGKTTAGELAAAIGPLAPTARAAGLSFEEMLGAISAVTKAGFPTREAITAVQGALSGINTISPEAAAKMKDLKLAFKVTGEEGATFADVMNNINTAAGGTLEGVLELIPNIRGAKGVLALAKDGGSDFAEVLELMGKKAGETGKAYAKMTSTFEFKSQRIKQSFNVAFIEVGNQLMPLMEDLANSILENMDTIKRGIAFAGAVIKDAIRGWLLIFNSLKVGIGVILTGALEFIRRFIKSLPQTLVPDSWDKSLSDAQDSLVKFTTKSAESFTELAAKTYEEGSAVVAWFKDVDKGAVKAATSMKDLTAEEKKALEAAGLLGSKKKPETKGDKAKPDKEQIEAAKKLQQELELLFLSGKSRELAELKIFQTEKAAVLKAGGEDTKRLEEAGVLLRKEIIEKYKDIDNEKVEQARMANEKLQLVFLEGKDRELAELQIKYEEEKALAIKQGADLNLLHENMLKRRADINKKWKDEESKQNKQHTQETINTFGRASQSIVSAIGNVVQMNQLSRKEMEKRGMTEEQISKQEEKQAKQMKKIALAQAIISGALAVQKALASTGPPLNYILAAATGILAASNVAKISSQAFEQGGFPQGRDAMIRVNERGQEAVLNARATAGLGVGGVNALNSGQEVNRTISNEIVYSPTITVSSGGEGLIDVLRQDKEKFAEFINNELVGRGYL